MKTFFFVLVSLFIGINSTQASFTSDLKLLYAQNDDIGLRVLLRKNYKKKLTLSEWSEARRILSLRPNIGYDIVTAWDNQITIKGSKAETLGLDLKKSMDKADELMVQNRYSEAFQIYQNVAKLIKKTNQGKISKSSRQYYLTVLHQIARSLYAQKRFNEALEVYSWIPPVYLQTRQIMFEKMWTAFRSNKFDMALGAIASQQSEYFSRYLDPESYLIKIYIVKKLCRTSELKATVQSIKDYIKDIRSGAFTHLDWAKGDLSRMTLARLILEDNKTKKATSSIISSAEKESEKKKIDSYLQKKFEEERPRLMAQLEKVIGYAAMAINEDQKLFTKVSTLPESSILESQGYELWPAKGGEEWTDEIGSHVFIGDSQCQKR
ncbi:MAG: hypothetical protein ACOYOK_09030 [Pseudobdellovibrionaceae bacterium]